MKQLKKVEMGWRAMEGIVNAIVGAINENAPVEGDGIRITSDSRGSVISFSQASTGSSSSGSQAKQGGGGGASILWHGVKWQSVDVMDSACNRSTITVLVNTGNSGDVVQIS